MKKLISAFLILFCCMINVYGKDDTNEPSLTVSVENTVFSPLANNKGGVIFLPRSENVKRLKEWSLIIKNDQDIEVKHFFGSKKLPERLVWNGFNEKNVVVENGQYSWEFRVANRGEDLLASGADIIIDTVAPVISVKTSNDVFFASESTGKLSADIVIYLSAGDENEINYSKSFLKIANYNNKVIKNFEFKDKIPELITWNGEDDIYNAPLPVGNYKIIFTLFDNAGNTSQISSEISVVPLPPEPEEVKEKGLTVSLSSLLYFENAKTSLTQNSLKVLKEIADLLKENVKNNVSIAGYTDSIQKESKNKALSLKRAQTVYDFLVKEGIDPKRMTIKGLGSLNPIASNATKQGRAKNRRVEITILEVK